jgi:hypothetical protein
VNSAVKEEAYRTRIGISCCCSSEREGHLLLLLKETLVALCCEGPESGEGRPEHSRPYRDGQLDVVKHDASLNDWTQMSR